MAAARTVRSLLAAAGLLLAASPVLAETEVSAPSYVFTSTAPFLVKGAPPAATVNITVGPRSFQGTASGDVDVFQVTSVPDGLHPWVVKVTKAGTTTMVNGSMLIDGRITAMLAQLSAIQLNLTDENATGTLAARLAAVEADLADLTENTTKLRVELPENVTKDLDGAVKQAVTAATLINAPDPNKAKADSAAIRAAESNANLAFYAAAACAVLLLVVAWLLVREMRRVHRETLVFVLAIAAHSGITPESPEFAQALEALKSKAAGAAVAGAGAGGGEAPKKKKLFALSFGKKKDKK